MQHDVQFVSYGCGLGFTCQNGVCVSAPPPPPPRLNDGVTCSTDDECPSSHCCASGIGRTCQAACVGDTGAPCTDASACAGGNCCCVSSQTGRFCSPLSCIRGAENDPCAGGDYCASGYCIGGVCSPPPGSEGTSCTGNSDCTAGECCATSATTKICRANCPPRDGDTCLESDARPIGFCQGAGSYPSSACKPGCPTTADCVRIHPDLVCWDAGTFKACDFGTSTWAQ